MLHSFRWLQVSALLLTLALLAGLPHPARAAGWGNLTGTFVYGGPAPKPAPIQVTKDVDTFGDLGLKDQSLVVGPVGGLANVIIYVRTKGVKINPELASKVKDKVELDNKGGKFVPHISTLWIGEQTLVLHNSDPVAHNSNIQPILDEGINPLLPPQGAFPHQFNRSQTVPVPVGCNIHPWMKGYVLPRDNPYVAVSGPDGKFKIADLPAGELEFQAWHERCGYLALDKWPKGRFTMTIKPGANSLGTIKVPPALLEKK